MPHRLVRNHRTPPGDGDALLSQPVLDRVFRQEHGRILAHLIGWARSFDLAEEALQDALVAAAQSWSTGLPRNPGAWLTTVARRKLISRVRRNREVDLDPEGGNILAAEPEPEPESVVDGGFPDERLKLLFVCCHPALTLDQQVPLILHTLGGLTTAEIAAAYLTAVPTMAQRLVRAKRKIAEEEIPFLIPDPQDLSSRLAGVLKGLYLLFTEGYSGTFTDQLIRDDLTREAIRLTRQLEQWLRKERTNLSPGQVAEVLGLLALMLLHEGRRSSRLTERGALVLLPHQDRTLWDKASLAEGQALLDCALQRGHPGPYQVQAAILQVHCEAPTAEGTDWVQIMGLYRQLLRWEDTPVVRLNAAVAVGQVAGASAALELIQPLEELLASFPVFWLVRAHWRTQGGDWAGAEADYLQALEGLRSPVERQMVLDRLATFRVP